MKFASAFLLTLLPATGAFTFTAPLTVRNAKVLRAQRFHNPTPLFMSDDQPSDSSSEDLVDVESETIQPSENDMIVSSILDEIPMEISGNISKETRSKINEAVLKLEQLSEPEMEMTTSPLLNGVWTLRYAGGYTSDWALNSPTRQIALFLYSGGYSPGIFALSLAQNLPSALCETGDLTITISREQPRVEAKVGVKFLGGSNEQEVVVKARLDVDSSVRITETYESALVLGQSVELPDVVQYSRELLVTYVDEDILVVRDASGIPEILVRKEYGA